MLFERDHPHRHIPPSRKRARDCRLEPGSAIHYFAATIREMTP
jgi:hypothetical protein